MSDPWITDWLHLLTRWFHLVVGAGWIGASFYFNWLNNNIRPVEDPSGRLAGALWSVHGGAFYQVSKFKGAPEKLPETLHWFKWEAYLTWLSGVCLLALVYWMQAPLMMARAEAPLSTAATVGVGVGSLALGWVVYDLLCRSPLVKYPKALALLGFSLLTGAAIALNALLSPRAATMHVGAMMGTMMALNVFFVIIPGQRAMVDAMLRGEEPDVSRGKAGALRSLHNNYFTLPTLFIMVSNHFPFVYGGQWGWAVVMAVTLVGVTIRHWINLHDRGQPNQVLLPLAALAMLALAYVSHGPAPKVAAADAPRFAEVQAIISARCLPCHAATPTFPGVAAPPKDLRLDEPALLVRSAALVRAQAVDTQTMPLGNVTQMTAEERATLGAWIAAGAPTR